MMSRYDMTDDLRASARRHLGEDIDVREVRLMAYVQYLVTNHMPIDPSRLQKGEKDILQHWVNKRWIRFSEGDQSGKLAASRLFWDAMSEILWHGYANKF